MARPAPVLLLLAFAAPAGAGPGEVLADLEGEQTALFERVAPGVAVLMAGRAVGAGFAVAPGLLLTAAHLVDGAAALDVALRDGRVVRGEVVERAAGGLDVALVRIPVALPVLALAPSAGLRPGRVVATVGHPDGNRFTLATGVVAQAPADGAEPSLVRLQLPVRPGASGGPVVDRAGQVVGVVALGASGAVAFAVSTEAALRSLRGLSAVAVASGAPGLVAPPVADAVPLAAPLAAGQAPATREDGVAAEGPGPVRAPALVTAPPDRPPRRVRAAGRAVGPIPREAAPRLVGGPALVPAHGSRRPRYAIDPGDRPTP